MARSILSCIFMIMLGLTSAQQVLIVENPQTLKNFKYYAGDPIIIRYEGAETRVSDQILMMTDSALILENAGVVYLSQIHFIYRENWLVQTLRGLTFIGGLAYFSLDSFNRLINHDSPVILAETSIISGSMIAFAIALTPFRYKKLNTKEKWTLRMLDLNRF